MWTFKPLKEEMKRKGVTQLDIVRGADLAPRTVSRLLSGENVSLAVIEKVAEYMGVDPCELMEWENDSKPV